MCRSASTGTRTTNGGRGEQRGRGAGGGGGREQGGGGAAVVLGREHGEGGFFARGFAEDLLDVFVASLGGLPGWVAEGPGLEREVEGVEEELVRVVVVFGG